MTETFCDAMTGGIGSGKSTVSSKFQTLGVPIVDADIISRALVKPGMPCLEAIIKEFGVNILDKNKKLDRAKLSNIIFNDLNSRNALESILHPAIYEDIERQILDIEYSYCLVIIPLLIETQAMNKFDRILVIDISEEIQIKRTMERDKKSIKQTMNSIKSQINREQRLKYADDVITNNTKTEDLDKVVYTLHQKYLNLAKTKY